MNNNIKLEIDHNPKAINSQLMLEAGFHIICDYVDQPGNQVVLAKKIG